MLFCGRFSRKSEQDALLRIESRVKQKFKAFDNIGPKEQYYQLQYARTIINCCTAGLLIRYINKEEPLTPNIDGVMAL